MQVLRTPDNQFESLPGYGFDPHYVDVAVARWEAFTGSVAVKAEPVVQIGGPE